MERVMMMEMNKGKRSSRNLSRARPEIEEFQPSGACARVCMRQGLLRLCLVIRQLSLFFPTAIRSAPGWGNGM